MPTLSTLRARVAESLRAHRAEWLVFGGIYLAHLLRFVSWVPRDVYPGGDGFYMYLLARSMAFDGDVDMANDYALCGDQWQLGYDYGAGTPANPYYIGPATVWAPVLFVLRRIVPLGANPPQNWVDGCRGPLVFALGVTMAPIFATLATYLGYRLARRFSDRTPSLVMALFVGFGSGLNTFGPLWWNYSHVWAAVTMTATGLAAARVLEREGSYPRWLALGAFAGWSYLMRPHHGLWLLLPFLMTLVRMVRVARERRLPWREALAGLVALAGFVAVGSIRAITFHALYGRYFPAFSTVYVQPFHAHPFLLLFSGRAGLLYQTPLMWFGVIGLFLALVHPRAKAWARAIVPVLLLDFWVCASPLDWPGGATIGPRLLVSFVGLFVAFGAIPLERIGRWATARAGRLRRLALFAWVFPSIAFGWQTIFNDPPHRMPDVYGSAVDRALENVDKWVGNPFTLPATLVFAARYRAHPRVFDQVSTGGFFRHNFDSGLADCCESINFRVLPSDVAVVEGGPADSLGLHLTPRVPTRVLFPLAWHEITSLVLRTNRESEGRCTLRAKAGQFTYTTELGRYPIPAGVSDVEVRTPPRALDSGIDELTLVSSCEMTIGALRFVDAKEHDVRTDMLRDRRRYVAPTP